MYLGLYFLTEATFWIPVYDLGVTSLIIWWWWWWWATFHITPLLFQNRKHHKSMNLRSFQNLISQ